MSHGGQVSHMMEMCKWREKQPDKYKEEQRKKSIEAYYKKKTEKKRE